jgi:hypothetical protein
MKGHYREEIVVAIATVLERGDQDDQPWAFHEHDHGGLKGFPWTKENADVERSNFIEAVIAELDRMNNEQYADAPSIDWSTYEGDDDMPYDPNEG